MELQTTFGEPRNHRRSSKKNACARERKRKKCSHVSGSRCSIGRKNICSHKFAQSFQTFCGQLQFYQNDYRDREKWIAFSIFSRNCGVFSLCFFWHCFGEITYVIASKVAVSKSCWRKGSWTDDTDTTELKICRQTRQWHTTGWVNDKNPNSV